MADCECVIIRESSQDLSELISVDKSPRLLFFLRTGESESDELGVSNESVNSFLLTDSSSTPLVERVTTLGSLLFLLLCLRLAEARAPLGGIMAVCTQTSAVGSQRAVEVSKLERYVAISLDFIGIGDYIHV